MKIGEVIRKYRKEKQMTQEELAEYLGVTSSAVNKWENGYSLPDIALLSPIARLFGISTDTLLSYKEELTDQEIERLAKEFTEKGSCMEYDGLFQWGMGLLKEYPNCEKLALNILPGLDAYKTILGVPDPEKYTDRIRKAYERLLKSENQEYVKAAAQYLFYHHINSEDYDGAGQVLGYFSRRDGEYKQMQALLYKKQGRSDEAYRTYEEEILEGYRVINGAFTGIFDMARSDGDSQKCRMLMEKQEQLAHLLEMGRYHEIYFKIVPALERKDKRESLEILKEMVEGIRDMQEFRKSKLYAHMDFKEKDIRNIAFMIKKGLLNDETVGFLREEPEYRELMEELEGLCG